MSFPRYPEYKDSGVEWLGEVPGHWDVLRLKNLVEEPLKYGANEAAELDDQSLPRFIRITDVAENGSLRDETFKSLPRDLAEPFLLKEGDLLLARSGATVGKSFMYQHHWGEACFAGYLIRVRLRLQKCIPQWFNYFCRTDFYWGSVLGSQIQSTIQNVNAEKYANLVLPVPSAGEQEQIVAFLDRETAKIDALVAEQEKLIALLQEKRQAVISDAVTKGLDPNAPLKDSGVEWLGEVPGHWEVRALKNIVSTPITDGPHETPQFFDEGIPFVSAEAVSQGFINFEKIRGHISAEDHHRYSQKYLPRRGDVYMVKSGATTGVTAIVETDQEFNIWSPLAALRCGEKMFPKYLLHYMRSCHFQEAVTLNWSFGTQQNIGMGVIGDLYTPVPPLGEQTVIASLLDQETAKLDRLTTEARTAIALLQERRTALISAAVTGQIDVRGLAGGANAPDSIAGSAHPAGA